MHDGRDQRAGGDRHYDFAPATCDAHHQHHQNQHQTRAFTQVQHQPEETHFLHLLRIRPKQLEIHPGQRDDPQQCERLGDGARRRQSAPDLRSARVSGGRVPQARTHARLSTYEQVVEKIVAQIRSKPRKVFVHTAAGAPHRTEVKEF